ncbi:unnamed protein product [Paramecium octaurelia]|uniref:Uncharacterized protein n=1 Tax=Paramecium octaurelia TaxID=43137 RepID=A0A8S1WTQ3_PAROT|nr:unnamed protein product [Paramecium octaurelia]
MLNGMDEEIVINSLGGCQICRQEERRVLRVKQRIGGLILIFIYIKLSVYVEIGHLGNKKHGANYASYQAYSTLLEAYAIFWIGEVIQIKSDQWAGQIQDEVIGIELEEEDQESEQIIQDWESQGVDEESEDCGSEEGEKTEVQVSRVQAFESKLFEGEFEEEEANSIHK